jgi:AcrR family transcriptional regulator
MASTLTPANARSRRTREALLTATRELLEEEGFEALTMTRVAERAGITRRAAYLHFPSRASLVGALFDQIAASEGLAESLARVFAAPDATSALDEWANHLARYHPRLIAVNRAIERVHKVDPDAAAHRRRVVAAQLENCRRLARWLDDEGNLAPGWTVQTATDMLWALISTDMIDGLLSERGWSHKRLATQLSLLLRSTFASDGRLG